MIEVIVFFFSYLLLLLASASPMKKKTRLKFLTTPSTQNLPHLVDFILFRWSAQFSFGRYAFNGRIICNSCHCNILNIPHNTNLAETIQSTEYWSKLFRFIAFCRMNGWIIIHMAHVHIVDVLRSAVRFIVVLVAFVRNNSPHAEQMYVVS